MTSYQQASWETNTYVVTTTRILVVFGLTYLVKSSYQLFRMLRATANGTVTSERSEYQWSSVHTICGPSADGDQ